MSIRTVRTGEIGFSSKPEIAHATKNIGTSQRSFLDAKLMNVLARSSFLLIAGNVVPAIRSAPRYRTTGAVFAYYGWFALAPQHWAGSEEGSTGHLTLFLWCTIAFLQPDSP